MAIATAAVSFLDWYCAAAMHVLFYSFVVRIFLSFRCVTVFWCFRLLHRKYSVWYFVLGVYFCNCSPKQTWNNYVVDSGKHHFLSVTSYYNLQIDSPHSLPGLSVILYFVETLWDRRLYAVSNLMEKCHSKMLLNLTWHERCNIRRVTLPFYRICIVAYY
jgi:hypothetical protein